MTNRRELLVISAAGILGVPLSTGAASFEGARAAAARRIRPKVGDPAPELSAFHSDGNALGSSDLAGRLVLVACWKQAADGAGLPFTVLNPLRRRYAARPEFLILTVCAGGTEHFDVWARMLAAVGTVDYGDGKREFVSDPRWWNVIEERREPSGTSAFGGVVLPEYHLIRPDGTLGAVSVPADELKVVFDRELRFKGTG